MTDHWREIAKHIHRKTGKAFEIEHKHPISGGCINRTFQVSGADQKYFVKLNTADQLEMFAAEAEGLLELEKAKAIRVPKPICWGCEGQAYLVMEYIPLQSTGDQQLLAQSMATLHQTTAPSFGWIRNNTIGATPQINTTTSTWVEFYAQCRLRFQLDLAAQKGGTQILKSGQNLLRILPNFFSDYEPVASLLHGDLWAGNMAFSHAGEPVIFDPAVYYGDRETDIAMTELFGGFSRTFYDTYHKIYPLNDGYSHRKTLYNLYHILNHYHLFGGGYLAQASGMIDALLANAGERYDGKTQNYR